MFPFFSSMLEKGKQLLSLKQRLLCVYYRKLGPITGNCMQATVDKQYPAFTYSCTERRCFLLTNVRL